MRGKSTRGKTIRGKATRRVRLPEVRLTSEIGVGLPDVMLPGVGFSKSYLCC